MIPNPCPALAHAPILRAQARAEAQLVENRVAYALKKQNCI